MSNLDYKNSVWENLVLNKVKPELNFLAAKILLFSLQMSLKKDPSKENVDRAKDEIFNLYMKNKELPGVQRDLKLILCEK